MINVRLLYVYVSFSKTIIKKSKILHFKGKSLKPVFLLKKIKIKKKPQLKNKKNIVIRWSINREKLFNKVAGFPERKNICEYLLKQYAKLKSTSMCKTEIQSYL